MFVLLSLPHTLRGVTFPVRESWLPLSLPDGWVTLFPLCLTSYLSSLLHPVGSGPWARPGAPTYKQVTLSKPGPPAPIHVTGTTPPTSCVEIDTRPSTRPSMNTREMSAVSVLHQRPSDPGQILPSWGAALVPPQDRVSLGSHSPVPMVLMTLQPNY